MEPGIFAKVFRRPSLESTLDAVAAHGFRWLQFNFSVCGLAPLPDRIDPALPDRIRAACHARQVKIAAVSGTFNMCHPDPQVRRDGLRRLEGIAAVCAEMGTGVITLCTGTRDPHDMWRAHPDNTTAAAWRDLLDSMARALQIAEFHHITLAFEPEISNVVDSAAKARQLLDEFRSPHLGVVIDAANLFHAGQLSHQDAVLRDAIQLLAPEIRLAHAKDLLHEGEGGACPAGAGRLDFSLYASFLHSAGYQGPWILHGLDESQVDHCRDFLLHHLPSSPSTPPR